MSSNPDLFAGAKPPAPRQPTPGEFRWLLVKDGRRLMCELRNHGEHVGVEVQLLLNEELFGGYRHPTRASAELWADEIRQDERDGWAAPTRGESL
jgi:hypothetical protein